MYLSALGLSWVCSVVVVVEVVVVHSSTTGMIATTVLSIRDARLFALQITSGGDLCLWLVNDKGSVLVNISLAAKKYDNESAIRSQGLGDDVVIVSRDKMDLDVSRRQFISVFRKDKVVAVYRAGHLEPFLVYEFKGSQEVDFGTLNVLYYVAPKQRTHVSFPAIGDSGAAVPAMAEPHGEVIKNELHTIRRVMYKRLTFMNSVFNEIGERSLPQDVLKSLKEVLDEHLSPHLALLDYYGIKLSPKYTAYRDQLFKKIRPQMIARLGT